MNIYDHFCSLAFRLSPYLFSKSLDFDHCLEVEMAFGAEEGSGSPRLELGSMDEQYIERIRCVPA